MNATGAEEQPDDRPWLGDILRVVAGLFFAAISICVKSLSHSTPLGEIVFYRSLFALIPLVTWPLMADLLFFHLPMTSAFVVALPFVLAGGAITVMGQCRSS